MAVKTTSHEVASASTTRLTNTAAHIMTAGRFTATTLWLLVRLLTIGVLLTTILATRKAKNLMK